MPFWSNRPILGYRWHNKQFSVSGITSDCANAIPENKIKNSAASLQNFADIKLLNRTEALLWFVSSFGIRSLVFDIDVAFVLAQSWIATKYPYFKLKSKYKYESKNIKNVHSVPFVASLNSLLVECFIGQNMDICYLKSTNFVFLCRKLNAKEPKFRWNYYK